MKKQILNLGKALSKAEQKLVNGGAEEDEGGGGLLGVGSLCLKSGDDPRYTCKKGLTCAGGSGPLGVCE